MARTLILLDGFSSREYMSENPKFSDAGGSPNRMFEPGDPVFVNIDPNGGRYFGQALNGQYNSEYGTMTGIPFQKNNESATLKNWFQFGYWQKNNLRLNPSARWISKIKPYHFPYATNTGAYTDYDSYTSWIGIEQTAGANQYKWYYQWGLSSSNRVYSSVVSDFIEEAGVWNWFEVRINTHISAGLYEVRINGVQQVRETGIRTMETDFGGFNAMYFYYDPSGDNYDNMRFDDMYIMTGDNEGDLSWFGKSVVEPIVPSGDGDASDGTPSTGTSHYAVVDELPKSDTDYLSMTAGNGKKELFSFSNIDITRTRTIHGVKVVARARKTGPGTRKLRPICKINGTVYNGDTDYVAPSWKEIEHIWRLNPDTSSAWTSSDVNGAQFGFEQVT